MEISHTRVALGVALVLATGTAAAQVADPAKLFSKPMEYQGATLSPTGDYVAVTTPFEDRRALSIIKLTGTPERNAIKFEAKMQPYGIHWTDDKRLVVEKALDAGYLVGSLASTGNVYAVNADATDQTQIMGYLPDENNRRSRLKDEGSVSFIETVGDAHGDALYYFQPWTTGNSQRVTSIYRIDTKTGSRKQVDRFDDSVDVAADREGTPRIAISRLLDGKQVVRYRKAPGQGDWSDMPVSIAGKHFRAGPFEADGDHLTASISDTGEPASLYRVSLSTATREKLASHPTLEADAPYDEDKLWFAGRAGHAGPPVVITYTSGKPKVDYLDKTSEWAKLHAGLMKAFPGQLVDFVDITRDDRQVLLFVYSDRHPGAYYLFDRETRTPKLLFEVAEWIDPAKMSPMIPVEFTNRAGKMLNAFYTAPQGKPGPHPMVVMPHGGPFGISDRWGYDADAQFLASLGYAVLQVNYRGSGDRGDDFETSGYAKWGTDIQDDIADGVKYAVANGLASAGKVCIYGVSFGGYSALMNPIRNPGMYKCSIAYAGVYDMNKHYALRNGSSQGRSFWQRTMGDESVRTAQSPASQVDKLDVPVLLIHGKNDTNVPFEQFSVAQAALAHAGKTYETLAKADEGHGFYKEANRAEAYERMKAFLLKYNPPN